jgi:hypothetical protein
LIVNGLIVLHFAKAIFGESPRALSPLSLAVDEARRIKASIPTIREYSVAIRDEIELERQV